MWSKPRLDNVKSSRGRHRNFPLSVGHHQVGGTYTLRVHGVNSSSTGGYRFAFDNFADSAFLAPGVTINATAAPYTANSPLKYSHRSSGRL